MALPVLIGSIRGPLTNTIEIFWLFTLVTLPFGILLVSLAIWIRASSLASDPGRYRRIGLVAFLSGIFIDVIFMGCLLLWALDVIASYESALVIAAVVSVSILIVVISRMRRGMKLALTGPEAIESQQIST